LSSRGLFNFKGEKISLIFTVFCRLLQFDFLGTGHTFPSQGLSALV